MVGTNLGRTPPLFLTLLVLGLVAIALYWPTIHAELIWDDTVLVSKYDLLNSSMWFDHSFRRTYLSDSYYRPIPLLSLFANAAFGAAALPVLAHATNLLLLVAIMVVIVLLVSRLQPSPWWLPGIAGLLFVIHPALIEPVAWVSGRCDLLATFFVLLALWLDCVLLQRPVPRLVAVSLSFFLAALSKEVAVVFPALWCIWRWYCDDVCIDSVPALWRWLSLRQNKMLFCALLATGVGYLLFRYWMLGHLPFVQTHIGDLRDFGSLLNRLLLVTKTFAWFWILLLFPHYDLSAVYPSHFPVPVSDRSAWLGIILIGLLLSIFASRRVSPQSKYALAGMVLLFLPVSNIKPVPVVDNFICLRYVLLPISFGLVVFVPLAYNCLQSLQQHLRALVVVVIALWGVSGMVNLYITIPLWSRELYLWKWVTETKPGSYIAWENYASRLYELGNFQACIDAELKSLAYYQDKPRTYLNLALCHDAMGKRDIAKMYAAQALQLGEKIRREPDMYAYLLTLYAFWAITELPPHHDTPIPIATQQQITGLLNDARSLDPSSRNSYLLTVAWCMIIGDTIQAKNIVVQLQQHGVDEQSVHAQMTRFKILDENQKQQLDHLIAEVYASP